MDIQKSIEQLKDRLDTSDMSAAEAREMLLTILSHSTQLYMELIKVNLELKKMPTERAGIISNHSQDQIM